MLIQFELDDKVVEAIIARLKKTPGAVFALEVEGWHDDAELIAATAKLWCERIAGGQ